MLTLPCSLGSETILALINNCNVATVSQNNITVNCLSMACLLEEVIYGLKYYAQMLLHFCHVNDIVVVVYDLDKSVHGFDLLTKMKSGEIISQFMTDLLFVNAE